MGIENATVKYDKSFAPYAKCIGKYCSVRVAKYPPLSVCIGTVRLTVHFDYQSGRINFGLCEPLLPQSASELDPAILSLPHQPIATDMLPQVYTYPGSSLLDPFTRLRAVMLAGPGGSVKSTVLKMVQRAMEGCCSMIPDGSLTSKRDGMSETVASAVVSSRMVVCYDVDLENHHMNLGTFKNISGGDYVQIGRMYTKSCCSLALATNGLPDTEEVPLCSSDAVVRRLLIVPMEVDVFGDDEMSRSADAALEPNDPVNYLDFIY
ncbi:hypothetical protein ColTof3_14802 [Colletotrichum tofieldiae]|nr:hypothetical protein ColTof3_14802 [Colletotrichum tofieldiae]